jgi:hypothetical protein
VAWFTKLRSKRSAEELLAALAECGISARSAAAASAISIELGSRFDGKYDTLLAALGDLPFDPATYELLEPYSDDVWHFDYEAIEDEGAYKAIVENCGRISSGELAIGVARDHVDIDSGEAWVEFGEGYDLERVSLRVRDDWADAALFQRLNARLEKLGSNRRLAQHELGQNVLFICKSADQIREINRVTGLRFHSHFR